MPWAEGEAMGDPSSRIPVICGGLVIWVLLLSCMSGITQTDSGIDPPTEFRVLTRDSIHTMPPSWGGPPTLDSLTQAHQVFDGILARSDSLQMAFTVVRAYWGSCREGDLITLSRAFSPSDPVELSGDTVLIFLRGGRPEAFGIHSHGFALMNAYVGDHTCNVLSDDDLQILLRGDQLDLRTFDFDISIFLALSEDDPTIRITHSEPACSNEAVVVQGLGSYVPEVRINCYPAFDPDAPFQCTLEPDPAGSPAARSIQLQGVIEAYREGVYSIGCIPSGGNCRVLALDENDLARMARGEKPNGRVLRAELDPVDGQSDEDWRGTAVIAGGYIGRIRIANLHGEVMDQCRVPAPDDHSAFFTLDEWGHDARRFYTDLYRFALPADTTEGLGSFEYHLFRSVMDGPLDGELWHYDVATGDSGIIARVRMNLWSPEFRLDLQQDCEVLDREHDLTHVSTLQHAASILSEVLYPNGSVHWEHWVTPGCQTGVISVPLIPGQSDGKTPCLGMSEKQESSGRVIASWRLEDVLNEQLADIDARMIPEGVWARICAGDSSMTLGYDASGMAVLETGGLTFHEISNAGLEINYINDQYLLLESVDGDGRVLVLLEFMLVGAWNNQDGNPRASAPELLLAASSGDLPCLGMIYLASIPRKPASPGKLHIFDFTGFEYAVSPEALAAWR
jgi:hypothetical protein